ncbi:hypothetical protein TNCV_3409351 [Trichonephila clavipes]|nr:hypothetical protein TNCV_3409351 [Trichonephila clavipes]
MLKIARLPVLYGCSWQPCIPRTVSYRESSGASLWGGNRAAKLHYGDWYSPYVVPQEKDIPAPEECTSPSIVKLQPAALLEVTKNLRLIRRCRSVLKWILSSESVLVLKFNVIHITDIPQRAATSPYIVNIILYPTCSGRWRIFWLRTHLELPPSKASTSNSTRILKFQYIHIPNVHNYVRSLLELVGKKCHSGPKDFPRGF